MGQRKPPSAKAGVFRQKNPQKDSRWEGGKKSVEQGLSSLQGTGGRTNWLLGHCFTLRGGWGSGQGAPQQQTLALMPMARAAGLAALWPQLRASQSWSSLKEGAWLFMEGSERVAFILGCCWSWAGPSRQSCFDATLSTSGQAHSCDSPHKPQSPAEPSRAKRPAISSLPHPEPPGLPCSHCGVPGSSWLSA